MTETTMDLRTLETKVFEALGAASTCWENMSDTGIFQSDRAKAIGDELMREIRDEPVTFILARSHVPGAVLYALDHVHCLENGTMRCAKRRNGPRCEDVSS